MALLVLMTLYLFAFSLWTLYHTEIETTNGSYFMSVDSAQERDEWIDSIRKSSVSYQLALSPAGKFVYNGY